MQSIYEKLKTAYKSEYSKEVKEKQYILPKIFHGGKDFDLSKRWYIYYSYRNSYTGEMKRQPFITLGVNRDYKSVKERMKKLKEIQKNLTEILKSDHSPYIHTETKQKYTAVDGLEYALKLKSLTLSETSKSDYTSRTRQFIEFIKKNGLEYTYVDEFKRKDVLLYLNEVLKKNAVKTRNNHRIVLSSLFSVLKENETVLENIVESIGVEKAKSTRHKTYSTDRLEVLRKEISKNKQLKFFIDFVSFGFLRPIEVVRLRWEDLKLNEKPPYLEVKAKNKSLKTKIIPEILIKEIEKQKKEKIS